jgi:hypothetical protein
MPGALPQRPRISTTFLSRPLGVLIPGVFRMLAIVGQRLAGLGQMILVAHPHDPAAGLLLGVRIDSLGHQPGGKPPGVALAG